MSSPTAGTLIFGVLAILTDNDVASVALAVLAVGCWINKGLEELKKAYEDTHNSTKTELIR